MTDYATSREELRAAELELMLQRERVAEMRRALPPGPAVEDYVFDAGDGATVRLSELFTAPDRPLILYHFMLGKKQTDACPMCSMWTDGWDAIAHHLAENVDFALVSAGPVEDFRALAAERGWTHLRLFGAADNTFKIDIGGEDDEGNQWPFLSVYSLVDGVPHLTYSGGAHISGDHWRGVDLLSPVWHFLDLTPQGRGNWMP
ncbi:MAG: DUF899 family protein [Acidimicrobiia bacterium]|nr:DUF899 family protein [Acidimicrobiia bacterium]